MSRKQACLHYAMARIGNRGACDSNSLTLVKFFIHDDRVRYVKSSLRGKAVL